MSPYCVAGPVLGARPTVMDERDAPETEGQTEGRGRVMRPFKGSGQRTQGGQMTRLGACEGRGHGGDQLAKQRSTEVAPQSASMSRGEGESAQRVFRSYVVRGRGELLLGCRISGAQAGQSLYCQAGLYGLWHTDLGVIHMGTEHEISGFVEIPLVLLTTGG